jgi:hypothetical protein
VVSPSRASPSQLFGDASCLYRNCRSATHGTRQQYDRGVLAVTLLVARLSQSLIHLLLVQTNIVAGLRFAFFFVQAICMIAMGLIIASSAPSWPIR